MPVTVEVPIDKWAGKVIEVKLGATKDEGGTRGSTVTVGGESSLPYLAFEGSMPNAPVVAVEVQDVAPTDWSPVLVEAWGDVLQDLAAWARKAVALGAKVIALKLRSADPDGQNASPAEAAASVKKVLAAVEVPLIVYGPGQAEKDNDVLVAVAEATAGERLALGLCEQSNYRTIVAACLGNGHIAIGRAPIDVNMQKQLNILISDMGLPLDRVLMDPTTGGLGYGIEYSFSVMERLRYGALQGDRMTQLPLINTVGEEAWRQKEAKAAEGVPATWGDLASRGVAWEILTATCMLEAGSDIVVLRHPRSIATVNGVIAKLMANPA
ncbi:MAG: acetyl-CoA decarbonylase/synthase complex subunit delta [Chloroflexota bacterium]